jgi:hypothetical protein
MFMGEFIGGRYIMSQKPVFGNQRL